MHWPTPIDRLFAAECNSSDTFAREFAIDSDVGGFRGARRHNSKQWRSPLDHTGCKLLSNLVQLKRLLSNHCFIIITEGPWVRMIWPALALFSAGIRQMPRHLPDSTALTGSSAY